MNVGDNITQCFSNTKLNICMFVKSSLEVCRAEPVRVHRKYSHTFVSWGLKKNHCHKTSQTNHQIMISGFSKKPSDSCIMSNNVHKFTTIDNL